MKTTTGTFIGINAAAVNRW